MKRLFLIFIGALSMTSCRGLIFEDRTDCPSFLFFNIENAEDFNSFDRVHVCAFDNVSMDLLAVDTTTVREIQDLSFYLPVKKSDAATGYGVLGFDHSHIENGTDWVVDEGENGDRLFRFAYKVPARDESVIVPVEMVKDYCHVTVKFLHFDMFTGSEGKFPFRVFIRGNTRGINALTGIPVRGPFEYEPIEEEAGVFRFVVPRQGDRTLTLDLWADEGAYIEEGLIRTFSLWGIFREIGDISWEAKNLPDIYAEIDFVESKYTVQVMDWTGNHEINYEF